MSETAAMFLLGRITYIQETPLIFACSNIDYLRSGNVKFNDKSLTLCNQEEGEFAVLLKSLILPGDISCRNTTDIPGKICVFVTVHKIFPRGGLSVVNPIDFQTSSLSACSKTEGRADERPGILMLGCIENLICSAVFH